MNDQKPVFRNDLEQTGLTPIPRQQGKSITMNFPDAMKEVIKGNKVTRISWANKDYCFLKGEWLTIYIKGAFHTWLISEGDMVDAEDWIVVIDATKN